MRSFLFELFRSNLRPTDVDLPRGSSVVPSLGQWVHSRLIVVSSIRRIVRLPCMLIAWMIPKNKHGRFCLLLPWMMWLTFCSVSLAATLRKLAMLRPWAERLAISCPKRKAAKHPGDVQKGGDYGMPVCNTIALDHMFVDFPICLVQLGGGSPNLTSGLFPRPSSSRLS